MLQCEEHVNTGGSWSLCERFLRKADEGNPRSTETEHLDARQHREDKRYGGFMKRYGGFMKRYGGFMKKTAEVYGLEPEHVDQRETIPTDHDVEMLTNQVEAAGERAAALTDEGGAPAVAKRYGGFMRRGGLYEPEGGIRALQKRYGGFMRRVGQPQWWQENKRYGGFLKRSREEDEAENSSGIEKRYGGFMGF